MSSNDIVSRLGLDNEFRSKYFVDDKFGANCKFIFILESPHTDEICYKFPVAGSAGKAMAKKLGYDGSTALGKLINDGIEKRFGLVNVCQIPMQSSPYTEPVKFQDSDLLSALEKIRLVSVKTKKRKFSSISIVEDIIIADLTSRLNKINNDSTLFIPCGNMAHYFCKKYRETNSRNFLDEVPHPSFNNWSKAKYKNIMDKLLSLINAQ